MSQHITTFTSLELSEALLKALTDMKFETPSPVQAQTIPFLLEGRDIIAQAQTGTGKTAAFALPILQKINPASATTQALILAPTRELAIQVAEQFKNLSKYIKGITVSIICGGRHYGEQLQQLKGGAQVVVGTPGRILDHIDRGTLKLGSLSTFILDEADEMLRMGFIEDVETILSKLPDAKQMALFSATMPPRIRNIATNYLNEPISVEIRSETTTVKNIEQRFLFASPPQKPDALLRILAVEDYQGVIVFVRTKSSTEEVATLLQQQQYRAMAIHGDVTQNIRERVIAQFREGVIDILVATDVAARGLDVDRVTHVINYDMPHDCETYVHRIGRTGRAGRSGVTVLFTTPREARILNTIERHTRQCIEKVMVPDDQMIQKAKQQRFLDKITARLEHSNLADYERLIEQYLKDQEASPVTVAAALALMCHQDRPWNYKPSLPKAFRAPKEEKFRDAPFKESKGFSNSRSDRQAKKAKHSIRDEHGQELFRIDVGRVHGVKPGNIVGAIANEAGLQSRFITGIKIHDDHSTVRLPKNMPKEVFQSINKAWVCGRQLKLTSLGAA
jgi:ATP-dependent RNA helicase DeaD